MPQASQGKFMVIIASVIVLAIAGYYLMHAPDRRTPAQKTGDAINALQRGADNAAQQLENRTPAEKLSDSASEAGDAVKKAVTPSSFTPVEK